MEDAHLLKIKKKFEWKEYIEQKEELSLLKLEESEEGENPWYHDIENYYEN